MPRKTTGGAFAIMRKNLVTPRARLCFVVGLIVVAAAVVAGIALSGTSADSTRAAVVQAQRPTRSAALDRRAAQLSREVATSRARWAKSRESRHLDATSLDPATAQVLRAQALWLSTVNGEAHPSGATVATVGRQAAASVIGNAVVDTDQQVFLVVLHGAFVGYMAKVPYGAALPTGSTMTIAYEPSTLDVTDWSINKTPIDTSSLGRPVALSLGP